MTRWWSFPSVNLHEKKTDGIEEGHGYRCNQIKILLIIRMSCWVQSTNWNINAKHLILLGFELFGSIFVWQVSLPQNRLLQDLIFYFDENLSSLALVALPKGNPATLCNRSFDVRLWVLWRCMAAPLHFQRNSRKRQDVAQCHKWQNVTQSKFYFWIHSHWANMNVTSLTDECHFFLCNYSH